MTITARLLRACVSSLPLLRKQNSTLVPSHNQKSLHLKYWTRPFFCSISIITIVWWLENVVGLICYLTSFKYLCPLSCFLSRHFYNQPSSSFERWDWGSILFGKSWFTRQSLPSSRSYITLFMGHGWNQRVHNSTRYYIIRQSSVIAICECTVKIASSKQYNNGHIHT